MWTGLLSIGLVSLTFAAEGPRPAPERADWTVLAYLSGDSDLEQAALGYLGKLGEVRGTDRLQIAAQIDRTPGHSREWGDFVDTRRIAFITRPGGDRREAHQTGWHAEANMGDPETLVSFASWGIETFPARHYLILLMGHGNGVRELTGKPEDSPPQSGIGYDASSEGDSLTVREIGEACQRIAGALGEQPIGLLALDSCFSATAELGCEVAPAVECLTGSPGLIHEPGVPWDKVLAGVAENPAIGPRDLARRAVQLVAGEQSAGDRAGGAYMAVDLELAPRFQVALGALCDELRGDMFEVAPLVTAARAQAPTTGLHSEMLDLSAALGALAEAAEEQGLDRLAEKADVARAIADAMVLAAWAQDGTDGQPTCRGWAVFFPPNLTAFPADYLESSTFARDTRWGAFLADYLQHLGHLITPTASARATSA